MLVNSFFSALKFIFSDASAPIIDVWVVATEFDGIYIDACDVSVPLLSITPICWVLSIG